jgi:hypothetical protein
VDYVDPCNLRSPQQHCGVVRSSNLCTAITLNTSNAEVAVCNLCSVNLVNHIADGTLDHEHLARTVKTTMRMLDNVLDVNYTSPEARTSARGWRLRFGWTRWPHCADPHRASKTTSRVRRLGHPAMSPTICEDLGVLRLFRVHLGPPPCASR